MRSSRRTPSLLSWVLVGSLSTCCSLALDLDRYSFDGGRGGTSGSAGGGGESGEEPTGGTAGSSSGTGGGVMGGAGGGGGDGAAGGAGGEAGAGGAPNCGGDDAPTNPDCELVPVAVYLSQWTGCSGPNVLGFAVDDSGALEPTPLPIAVSHCETGALLVSPNRRHLIGLTTGSSGPITYTYDIDPATFDLEESLEAQPMQTSGDPGIDWSGGAVLAGPEGADHDYLIAVNTTGSEGLGGVYLFSIDRGANPGRIDVLEPRLTRYDAWAPVFHPTGSYAYYVAPINDINVDLSKVRIDVENERFDTDDLVDVALAPSSRPKQLAIDGTGALLYLLDEAKITSFTVRSSDGELLEYLTSPALTDVYFQRFALHPNGRFLYAIARTTLRAYESDDGAFTELDLDADPMNGVVNALELADAEDVAIDASGRSLYVVTRQSVRSFAIGSDGSLTERTPATPRGGYRLALLHAWRPRR